MLVPRPQGELLLYSYIVIIRRERLFPIPLRLSLGHWFAGLSLGLGLGLGLGFRVKFRVRFLG